MSFTVRAVLRVDKENKKGLCPVSVVVTVSGRRSYHSTGISIRDAAWDADNACIRKGVENGPAYNTRIANKIAQIRKELMQAEDAGEILTTRKAKAIAGTDEAKDFYSYAEKVIRAHKNPGTKRRREFNLKALKDFAGPNLSFVDITPVFLTRFGDYMLDTLDNESNTTISGFSMIRAVFNHAIERGVTKHYPFRRRVGDPGFVLPAYEEPIATYLTLEECDKIESLLHDEDTETPIKKVAAFFLLECYSAIRFSDWPHWMTERLIDDEKFKLTTTKNGETIYLPLEHSPRLAGIIKYIRDNNLIWTESGEHANRILKLIAPTINKGRKEKKHLTTHVGRHTAATMLLEKGFSMETVAQVLGITVKQATRYAKITRQKVKGEYERLGGL